MASQNHPKPDPGSDSKVSDELDAPTGGRCPICGAGAIQRYRPFCSKRCADVDLSRWLTGRYAVAGGNDDADEDGEDARAAWTARQAQAGRDHDED